MCKATRGALALLCLALAFVSVPRLASARQRKVRVNYSQTVLKNGLRGKYVQRLAAGSDVVRLAPDVAATFPTEKAVNEALRLLLNVAKTSVPYTR